MTIEHYHREYEGDQMTVAEYCRLPEVDRGSTELTDGRLVFLLGVGVAFQAFWAFLRASPLCA